MTKTHGATLNTRRRSSVEGARDGSSASVDRTHGWPRRADATGSVVELFLPESKEPLVSYRSLRRLTAATKGGRVQASLTAWTSFDQERERVRGFGRSPPMPA